ncbi:MAG TPA: hypothetical protein DCE44_15150 [Verrucomicrobiales bacterium]|nr:hypothetical protein [Verrucomicrobiales bacterium]
MAQSFLVDSIGFGNDGRPFLRHPADAGSYYILYRGDTVAAIRLATDMALGVAGTGQLNDRDPVNGIAARFYRIEQVPLNSPKDSDNDGINDVYELQHPSILNPLNTADALNDPDHDGKNNLQEYQDGTDPGSGGDNQPPSVSITASTLVYELPATVQLGATARDADGSVVRVEYYSGGRKIGESTTSPFNFAWAVPEAGIFAVSAVATDNGGASATSRPMEFVINVPAPVLDGTTAATAASVLKLTGRGLAGTQIRVEGGASIATGSVSGAGTFSVDVALQLNRANRLFVTATDSKGNRSAPRPLEVLQDGQVPNLFIDFPPAGTQLSTESFIIAGRVGDVLSGYQGLMVQVRNLTTEDVSVPANVDVGIGPNGTYERGAIPLRPGPNTIEVTALDKLGNSVQRTLNVVRVELSGPQMAQVSGDGQLARVHARVAQPIVVKVARADGTPIAHKVVRFEVSRSDGLLGEDENQELPEAAVLTVATDTEGLARVWWRMGSEAGCGNNRVIATSKDIAGQIFFCASSTPAPPRQINVGSGNNQRAEAGSSPPEPLRAWVSDSCNGGENTPVTFRVIRGSGTVNGQNQVIVRTSRTGHAEVTYVAGADGSDGMVEANFPGNTGAGAQFLVDGVLRVAGHPTTFSGQIFDNSECGIGGARVVLVVGDRLFMTSSDITGRFNFANLPAGPGTLNVDGLQANFLNGNPIPQGSFPGLAYPVVLVPNAENSLNTPVLLPHMNPKNARVYDGTRDVVLTCEGVAGLRMTVKAGSMRRPDGSRPSPADPAILSLNQVHHDDIPMPMPDGASPPFAWTLQPGGSTFDPPIQIEYPNMTGLPPRSIAYFLSFNHGTQRFEIVSSAHVSNDGARIFSDPGSGLTLAGWGCNCPPYSVTGSCSCN